MTEMRHTAVNTCGMLAIRRLDPFASPIAA
jgi:hypothetical protein